MKRIISSEVKITVEGIHTQRNSKEVYCITDGRTYVSVSDAAESAGVTESTMSYHLVHRTKSCGGKQWCYLRDMAEHHDRIANHNHNAIEKVANLEDANQTLTAKLETTTTAANEAIATLDNIRRINERVVAAQANVERLMNELADARLELDRERERLAEAIRA